MTEPLPHPLARRDLPADLDQRGFVRVNCLSCKQPDVWFRCDKCKKADHFLLTDDGANCSCGANYSHGTCTCGEPVPRDQLVAVPFEKGPMALADLEVAWGRLIAIASVLFGGLALLLWWAFGGAN